MKLLVATCAAAVCVSATKPSVSFLQMKRTATKYDGYYETYDDFAEDPDGMTVEEAAQQGSEIDDAGEMDLDMVENGDQDAPDPQVYPGEDVALEDANDEENDFAPSHDHVSVIHHGARRYNNRDMQRR
ncbi:unnamed protein product [Amoebophrya sp. A25]|nr:unnamed protein product [Amoebophrya sp. A25]|eukprot:GSA25T00015880001.1